MKVTLQYRSFLFLAKEYILSHAVPHCQWHRQPWLHGAYLQSLEDSELPLRGSKECRGLAACQWAPRGAVIAAAGGNSHGVVPCQWQYYVREHWQ